jgi:hypothetical protein
MDGKISVATLKRSFQMYNKSVMALDHQADSSLLILSLDGA